MKTWAPDTCDCKFAVDFGTGVFTGVLRTCEDHSHLTGAEALNAAIDLCQTKNAAYGYDQSLASGVNSDDGI